MKPLRCRASVPDPSAALNAALREITADLEIALADAVDGLPPGPSLYKRLRRIVESRIAHRIGRGPFRGIRRARVLIQETSPGVVSVELALERGRTVERVRLTALGF